MVAVPGAGLNPPGITLVRKLSTGPVGGNFRGIETIGIFFGLGYLFGPNRVTGSPGSGGRTQKRPVRNKKFAGGLFELFAKPCYLRGRRA